MSKPAPKKPLEGKLTPERRRKNLCRAIALAWGSLDTHLGHSIKAPKVQEFAGDEVFNAAAIREYAEIILICAVELEILAKKKC